MSKLVVVGGSGKVAKLFTRLVASRYEVHSIVRRSSAAAEVEALGARPVILSLTEAKVEDIRQVIEDSHFLLWSAGAGGRQGPEGSVKIDFEGAVKVFDAIEQLPEAGRPRVLVVSAIDVRDPSKAFPDYYSEADKEASRESRESAGMSKYYESKWRADRDLAHRKGIEKWTILKPGALLDDAPVDKVAFGITGMQPGVTRSDVASVLAELLERGEETYGKAYNLVGGDTPIKQAVDAAIKEGVNALNI